MFCYISVQMVCYVLYFVPLLVLNVPGLCCKFRDSGIVPDVVDRPPNALMPVTYKNGARVAMGNELTPSHVKEEPQVHYPANPREYYTIVLTDPDAPSRENNTWAEWKHWLVCNIPGTRVQDGTILAEYVGSAPPQDSGYHRYVFLAFKQPGILSFEDEETVTKEQAKPRVNFSIRDFAVKYNLGNPIAGNYFIAKYDDSVPSTYEQFTD